MNYIKIALLAILVAFISTNAEGQLKLSLLNGNNVNISEYTFYNDKNDDYLEYKIAKKNGNFKTKYTEAKDVWSINDSIVYVQVEENEYSVEEMRNTVIGRQQAAQDYHAWWAGVTGFVVGAGSIMASSTYGLSEVGIAGSIVYATGMSFVRPTKKSVKKKYPEYADNEYFVYGYQNKARKKIFVNTIVGTLSGLAVGGLVSVFIPRQSRNTIPQAN